MFTRIKSVIARRIPFLLAGLLMVTGLLIGIRLAKLQRQTGIMEDRQRQLASAVLDVQRTGEDSTTEFVDMLKQFGGSSGPGVRMIMKRDDLATTRRYLTRITNRYCPNMKYALSAISQGSSEDFFYNEYVLTGQVELQSLYNFIYQIESQTRLYIIEVLEVQSLNYLRGDTLDFAMTLRAYYHEEGADPDAIRLRELTSPKIDYNIFYPRIRP